MKRLAPFLLGAGLAVVSTTPDLSNSTLHIRAPGSLGLLFDICIGGDADKLAISCKQYYEEQETKPKKALNTAWDLIRDLNAAAIYALTDQGYENEEEHRRMATRFFSIRPTVPQGSKGSVEGKPDSGIEQRKSFKAREWFMRLQQLLDDNLSGQPKPMLYFDSAFMELAIPEWPFCDTSGCPIVEVKGGPVVPLGKWSNFNTHWVFQSMYPLRAFFRNSKASLPNMNRNLNKPPAPFGWVRDDSGVCNMGADATAFESMDGGIVSVVNNQSGLLDC